jgi:hypothetical protein
VAYAGVLGGRSSVSADTQVLSSDDGRPPRFIEAVAATANSGRMPEWPRRWGRWRGSDRLGSATAVRGGLHVVSEAGRASASGEATQFGNRSCGRSVSSTYDRAGFSPAELVRAIQTRSELFVDLDDYGHTSSSAVCTVKLSQGNRVKTSERRQKPKLLPSASIRTGNHLNSAPPC